MDWKYYCKIVFKYAILPIGFIYRCFHKSKNEIVVLMYHRVNDGISKELAVTRANFQWQMDYLKRHDYQILNMDQACQMIRQNKIRGKWIVISFDDGYEDFYHNAFPILEQYSFPSIMYLVAGYIETNRVLWWDSDLGESPLLNWQQILKMEQSGLVIFGSHSLSHLDMDRLPPEQILQELEGSKAVLEEHLHHPVIHFSYPRGKTSKMVESLVGGVYQTGVLMYNGKRIGNRKQPNLGLSLKRMAIQRSDGKALFVAKINGWLIGVELIRKLLWNLNLYSGATYRRQDESRRVKLLIGITLSEIGGAQKMVFELVAGLAEEKYDISIVTAPNGELLQWIENLNQKRVTKIKVITLPWLVREINPPRDLRLFLSLLRLMLFRKYDIAHFHSSKMGILGPVAAFLARIPRIFFTVHGWGVTPAQSPAMQRLLGKLIGIAVRFCSAVICVSANERWFGIEKGWLSAPKCRVIHNGIEEVAQKQGELRRILGDNQIPIIGTICRLAEPKDPVFTIKIARLLKIRGYDFQLVILGDGPLRKQCETEIAAANLGSVVRMLGTREDARELLNDFDIFVLFSKSEALPLTVIEAMFAGKPVVASRVGGMDELFNHREEGFLIEPGESEAAVNYLEDLIKDHKLRERMGHAAQIKAIQCFSRTQMVREYEKVYHTKLTEMIWNEDEISNELFTV